MKEVKGHGRAALCTAASEIGENHGKRRVDSLKTSLSELPAGFIQLSMVPAGAFLAIHQASLIAVCGEEPSAFSTPRGSFKKAWQKPPLCSSCLPRNRSV